MIRPLILYAEFVLLSLVVICVAGNDKKIELIHRVLFATSQDEPKLSIDQVAKELVKYRHLVAVERLVESPSRSVSEQDRLDLQSIDSLRDFQYPCTLNDLQARLELNEKYDEDHFNLRPYITFMNLIQSNICYQAHENRQMERSKPEFDTIKWVLFYDSIRMAASSDVSYDMGLIRSDSLPRRIEQNLASLTNEPEERYYKRFATRLAQNIKQLVYRIDSKYFPRPKLHDESLENEIRGLLNDICPRLTRTFGPAEENDDYDKLMQKIGDDLSATNLDGLLTYSWPCKEENRERLIGMAKHYFHTILNDIEFEDLTEHDYIGMRRILFSKDDDLRLRWSHQFTLINELYTAIHDNPEDFDSQMRHDLEQLIELREINIRKCTGASLNERLELERRFDEQYRILHPYIASLNVLQFEFCNQKLRYQASRLAFAISGQQLAQLEHLRTLIDQVSRDSFAMTSAQQLIDNNVFARGSADYLYLSSVANGQKVSKRNFATSYDSLMSNTCSNVASTMKWELDTQITLIELGLASPLDKATRRLLAYGRICEHYDNKRYQLSSIMDQFEGSAIRYPNRPHQSWLQRLNCLKPKVAE